MADTLKIVKKGTNKFWHIHNGDISQQFAISDFEISLDGHNFNIIQNDGTARFTYLIENIIIQDLTSSGINETFTNPETFYARLNAIGYTPFFNISVIGLTTDEIDALHQSNTPSFNNPFATILDLQGVSSGGIMNHLEICTGLSIIGNNFHLLANTIWYISGIRYTNPTEIIIPIAYTSTGKVRQDLVVLNTSNSITILAGDEVDNFPAKQPQPVNTVYLTDYFVNDSSFGDPTPPIVGDIYVKKQESQDFIVNYGATTVIDHVDLTDDRSSISLTNSVTDIKSVNLSGLYIRPGKPHFVKNRTGHNVKIWHLAGTGNIKYFFPNGLDLIVKPNEVIEFNTNANDSSTVRFEYVGNYADLSNYYTKSQVDSADATTLASANAHSDSGDSQLKGGELTYDTLKKLADEVRAQRAIIGGTTPDGDSVVNTVTELLAVMATFPEGVDLFTLLAGKVNTTDVYNALDCIVSGKVADARTVKVLNDAIATLTTTVSGKEDTSNKIGTVIGNESSTAKYLHIAGAVAYFQQKFTDSSFGAFINSLTAKPTPVDADSISIVDSADSNKQKKTLLSDFKAFLLEYFRGQIEVNSSTTMPANWKGKLILFTANCTVTVPDSLVAEYAWEGYTMTGVTVTWAITSPKTWENGTPLATPANTSIAFFQRGSTNSVILLQ